MDNSRSLLGLLEGSSEEGKLIVALHIFSEGKEIGKLILIDGEVLQFGGVNSEMCNLLGDEVKHRYSDLSTKRISQFSMSLGESALQITAELLGPAPHLFVFGAGHVGQAVAMIGALVGYDVVVVDDRAEFLNRDRFPNETIRLFKGNYDGIVSRLEIPANSAIVIVTRGHQFDEVCLEHALQTSARYVGMIGSKRRVLSIFSRLVAAGITRESLSRVHAPIGVKIGAISPQEIAVSIMAEIISIMNESMLDKRIERRKE
ncbi:MAG TPA: XdhC family protein [Blastocatellia bacterium]|nr:XdhC family protein [Blastocatellia bacterium]